MAKHRTLPKDLFTKPESDLAQEHQHVILKGMIDEQHLRTYFRNNKQLEPLILDSDGFVVNGNRRLCAMREYYYSKEREKYKHFRNIDVVFLPPSDQKAILELEDRLQLQQDIKAEYRWYNTPYMYKRLLREGMAAKELYRIYEIDQKELNYRLATYDEAERYLNAQKKPGEFSTITDSKYAFEQLVKALKVVGEDRKDSFLPLAYLVIEKAEGKRAYDQIPGIARNLDKILEKVPTVASSARPKGTGPTKSGLKLLGGKKAQRIGKVVVPRLETQKARDDARATILDILGEQETLRREHKKGNFVRAQIEKADQCLQNAFDGLKTAKDKKILAGLLTRVEKSAARLRRAIGR
ncbi:MAG: hypothetical protein WD688_27155 [Candidatus Binatia bacterium]